MMGMVMGFAVSGFVGWHVGTYPSYQSSDRSRDEHASKIRKEEMSV